MDRLVAQGGLTLVYEMIRMALTEIRRLSKGGGPPASEPGGITPSELQKAMTSGFLLSLLVLTCAGKAQDRDMADERYRGVDLMRLLLLDILVKTKRPCCHLSAVLMGLTTVEVLISESTLRQAFLDMGGIPILTQALCRIRTVPQRRSHSVDVRSLAYDMMEGKGCWGCYWGSDAPLEACCQALEARVGLKIVDVLWCASVSGPQDGVEMQALARDASGVLNQIMTPGLIKMLRVDKSPLRFLSAFFTPEPIRRPTLIWDATLRQELAVAMKKEAEQIVMAAERARWPLWHCKDFVHLDGYRHQYPSLQGELVVNEIFLRPILHGDMDLGGEKVGSFLEALEVSIQSSYSVLQHLLVRGGRSPEDQEMMHRQEEALALKQDAFEAMLR
jgi:hypothetical protein